MAALFRVQTVDFPAKSVNRMLFLFLSFFWFSRAFYFPSSPLRSSRFNLEMTSRYFSNYAVYKGKGALCVKIIPPTWVGSEVKREGVVLFELAPATGAAREYDWTRKLTFSLDVTECGEWLDTVG